MFFIGIIIVGIFIDFNIEIKCFFTELIIGYYKEIKYIFLVQIERPVGLLCPILHVYSTRVISGPINVCLPMLYEQINGWCWFFLF